MNKIGLFAGAFDPIHLGHTDFIGRAIKQHGLDKVYLLIEREPKYKTGIAPYEDRLAMVRLALSDTAKAEIYESESTFFPLSSSLPDIRRENPSAQLFLLLGEDVAKHINEWENSEALLKDTRLIVASRGGDGPYSEVSSLKIRRKLKDGDQNVELHPDVLRYCLDRNIY